MIKVVFILPMTENGEIAQTSKELKEISEAVKQSGLFKQWNGFYVSEYPEGWGLSISQPIVALPHRLTQIEFTQVIIKQTINFLGECVDAGFYQDEEDKAMAIIMHRRHNDEITADVTTWSKTFEDAFTFHMKSVGGTIDPVSGNPARRMNEDYDRLIEVLKARKVISEDDDLDLGDFNSDLWESGLDDDIFDDDNT